MGVPMPALGVDIGGTSMRLAAIDGEGRILDRRAAPTPGPPVDRQAAYRAVIRFILDGVRELRAAGAAVSCAASAPIGIACAGILADDGGSILRSVNLGFLEGRDLRSTLRAELGGAVELFTDIAAATWGEYQALTRPPARFGHLRLGTGAGYAQIQDGAFVPLHRRKGQHLDILRAHACGSARPCRCGATGCLETYVSRDALRRHTAEERSTSFAQMLLALESVVAAIRRRLGRDGILAVGGGLLEEYPILAESLGETPAHAPLHEEPSAPARMVRARLADDAGVIGAARLVRYTSPSAPH